jgi:hypothetical protein
MNDEKKWNIQRSRYRVYCTIAAITAPAHANLNDNDA